MTVKLIRMWSGEDVVADLIEEKTDSIVITNPIVAVPTGQEGQIAFAPWSPILKKEGKGLEITKRYVVYIDDAQEEIVEQYNSMFGKLSAPTKKLIL